MASVIIFAYAGGEWLCEMYECDAQRNPQALLCPQRASEKQPQIKLKTLLQKLLPKRLIKAFIETILLEKTLQEISYEQFQDIASQLQNWSIKPNGTEGYRTAEVTIGGVDCDAISSKTFEAKSTAGLYFIGEVMDITGWLGGYNFQWSWSSGWCAGQYV